MTDEVTCDERQPKAWRNGRYIYCLNHSNHQVYESQTIYKGDTLAWKGRRCDWCKKEIK